ncbi:hypothetical protein Zmor_020155 [Zophobas morio]|uniref:Uncharacterized protein n=1 Tax=Zophobas morio TaxID=2755281 RepID=A0AA38I3G2_9CUCU|nr:hypothetical protein Zmor_020155 [Zophobas morio]
METKQTPAKPLKVTTEEGTTYEFEEVNRFKYLGVVITNKNEMNEEIEERIAKANKSVGRLNRFLRSKNVTRRTKKQVYKTIVRPTVLYASETEVGSMGTQDTTKDIWRYKRTRPMEKKNKPRDRGNIRRTNNHEDNQSTETKMARPRRKSTRGKDNWESIRPPKRRKEKERKAKTEMDRRRSKRSSKLRH